MKISKIILSLFFVGGITLSCNRTDNVADNTVDEETLKTEAVANYHSDADMDMAMDLGQNFSLYGKGGNPNYPCATITITDTNGGFPKTITVDFGTAGCTTPNGITRKGKVIITVSNKFHIPGSSVVVTHENYFVNDNKVEGTFTMTNITTDSATPSWSRTVVGGRITNPDGKYFTFDSVRKQRMIAGVATPLIIADDVFEIYEGTQNISRSNGTYLNSNIKTALLKKNTCPFVSKGSVYLKGTKLDGTLDFGNGDCDNQATFTDANGVVHQITLK